LTIKVTDAHKSYCQAVVCLLLTSLIKRRGKNPQGHESFKIQWQNRKKMPSLNIHIHDRRISWLGTRTSIKGGCV
jgi:hypothetical protein